MQSVPGVRLVTVRGVPVYLKKSWFVLMALVIVGYGLYLAGFPGVDQGRAFTISTTVALLIALGVLIHELAHAMAGLFCHRRIQYISMTLWGGVTKLSPGTAASSWVISVAGPLVNLGYAGLLYAVLPVLPETGLGTGVAIAADANLMISLFNLVPSYPLDGGHALEAFLTMITGRRVSAMIATAWVGLSLIPILVIVVIFFGLWRSTPMLALAAFLGWYIWSSSIPILKAFPHRGDSLRE